MFKALGPCTLRPIKRADRGLTIGTFALSQAGICCATMDVAEEVGIGGDVGSSDHPRSFRGGGAALGRGLQFLDARTKLRPDHTRDGHHRGPIFPR
jgi:hypothetical protein